MLKRCAIRDRAVDRLDHVADDAPALRVQHLEADDVRPRRHALGLVEAVAAGRSDDARPRACRGRSGPAPVPRSSVKSSVATMRPRNSGIFATPESMTATPMPLPVSGPMPCGPPAFVDEVRADRLVGHGHLRRDHVIARKLVDLRDRRPAPPAPPRARRLPLPSPVAS